MKTKWLTATLIAASLIAAGCGGEAADQGAAGLTGTVAIDGSSTVFPITEAVAEEFLSVEPRVRVTVGISGTGGGFKKFTTGETDINDASRPIKPSEIEKAAGNGVDYVELPVAFDGLSVVVNPANDWVDSMTVAELKAIWEPGSAVTKWSEVRDGWPEREITLYGPGTDSGTFDYFTEAVMSKSGAARPDYTASEDDNVLVQGVAGDQASLGFFGFAYYVENQDKIKVVPIDGGAGPVTPSHETIANGTYTPLSRPLFVYVGVQAGERPEVQRFVDFYLEQAGALAEEVGYVALPDFEYDVVRERWAQRVAGTVFGSGDTVGKSISELFGVGGDS